MKTLALSATLLCLLQSTTAQYAQARRHAHLHQRYGGHVKPEDRITVEDSSVAAPTEVPEVVVYVDGDGNPVRTATEILYLVPSSATTLPLTTQTPHPGSHSSSTFVSHPTSDAAPSPSAASAIQEPGTMLVSAAVAATTAATATQDLETVSAAAASTATASTSASPKPVINADSGKLGVAYAPYTSSGDCKSADEVLSDFQRLAASYSLVRTYGVDCDQVDKVMAASVATGVRVMLGIYSLDNLDGQVGTLVSAVSAHGGWDYVDSVSVGNELVNNGQASPGQVVGAVQAARWSLRSAGFTGPVVTVDTFIAAQNNPQLCDASDFCAVNMHPFFDPNTAAGDAGAFMATQMDRLRAALANPGQRIVITETGWPWQGDANGAAVPSRENQAAALASIRNVAVPKAGGAENVILFSAINDLWKRSEPATFHAEQFWGIEQF